MNGRLASSIPGSRVSQRSVDDLDVVELRREFPALDQLVQGKPLVYLDSAASSQKPRSVLDAVVRYYEASNANVHRGVHTLSDRATTLYEQARARVQAFLNAREHREIVFVRGTTEAINLVAQTFGRRRIGPGDEVVVSGMEHDANIVPWQVLCEERGASLQMAPVTDAGELSVEAFEAILTERTRLVALTHVSNVLGTVNPIKNLIRIAHQRGIPALVDGAQGVPHVEVDVQDLDCDFYAFSGHKVYGPMGIGVLFGKACHLEEMPPWQCGGGMVRTVSFEGTTFSEVPYRFEAGTPDVAGAVGLQAALELLDTIGRGAIARHEQRLLDRAVDRLRAIRGVRLIGTPATRAGVVSFVVEDPPLSALDVGGRLDLEGIAVRSGHHCCQPLMERFGVPGSIRVSVAAYNSLGEIDRAADALQAIVQSALSRCACGAPPRTPGVIRQEYPPATAKSVEAAAAKLLDDFDALESWAEKYEYLIELGLRRPVMPPDLMVERNRVRGCQSTVFLAARVRPGSSDVVEFLAESDSEIVRGLLALLQYLFSGHRAAEILNFDLTRFLERSGLDANLTTGRRNGLAEMIRRLRAFAAGVAVEKRRPEVPLGEAATRVSE
jgi:cysteine desulfurase/selenocysteine lyase